MVAIGYIQGCEAEADALDSADENYMFSGPAHRDIDINLKQLLVQAGIVK